MDHHYYTYQSAYAKLCCGNKHSTEDLCIILDVNPPQVVVPCGLYSETQTNGAVFNISSLLEEEKRTVM